MDRIYVYPLELSVTGAEGPTFIYPALIQTDDELILVDTGYPGQAEAIIAAAAKYAISLEVLTRIVLTHHDFDHIGSLNELTTMYPQATVVAPALETAFINGSRKAFRLQQAEGMYNNLPEEAKEGAKQFAHFLKSISPCEVDVMVNEGDAIDAKGLIKVIDTPGHTEGHISLWLESSKTIIAGDALLYEDGLLKLANPHYAYDLALAQASAERVREMEPELIICYHGGVCRNPYKNDYVINEYKSLLQKAD